MTKRIFITNISVMILLSLLVVANYAQYHDSEILHKERQDSANIIRESLERDAETQEKLKAKASVTLKGFAGGFLENTGQKNEAICYFAQSSQLAVGFGASTLWFTISSASPTLQELAQNERLGEEGLLRDRSPPTTVGVTFPGSNPVVPLAETPTGAYSNYYRGADPTKWSTHNVYYAKLIYRNLYEQIDLVYELHDGQLKYEFIVNPGGTPESIRVHWNGPVVLSHQATGLQITIDTATGPFMIIDSSPLSYQADNPASTIPSAFFLEDTTTYGFSVPVYDPTRPLIIDPFLSTFLGGSGNEGGQGPWDCSLALDGAGNIWVAGHTYDADPDFPTTPDALNLTHNGDQDVYVAQLAPNGSTLLYSTLLGGTGYDTAYTLAVDGAGNVWAGGQVGSTDFPTTTNALNTSRNAGGDAFLVQLAADGSTLLYSTYLGGDLNDFLIAIAFDAAGNVWFTGATDDHSSNDFPTTADALNTTHNGPSSNGDIYIAQMAADGSKLLYSTFLGGTGDDAAWALALDDVGNVWVAGFTSSGDFPTTGDALNKTGNGGQDVFLALLKADGSLLLYSTYLGGSGDEDVRSLALDSVGNVWFTGRTYSGNFPTTPDALNGSRDTAPDAYIAQLAASGNALLYSTYLGGGGYDAGHALALDATGNVWFTGTTSLDFPTTGDAFNTTNPGGWDAIVVQLAANGSALLYSTYLGGDANDMGHDLAVDAAGNIWVTGYTADHAATDFPISPNAFDPTHNGGDDAFLFGLLFTPEPPQTLSATISADNVTLTWAVPAMQGRSPITAYRVYRSTTSGAYGAFLAETAETTTTFNDSSSLTISVPYYYIVTAVNSYGESFVSNEVTITLTVPSAPQVLVAAPGTGLTVMLTWGAPTMQGSTPVTMYRVYRNTTSGDYTVFLNETSTTAFNDSTVLLGTTYYYILTAVNSIGESGWSNEVNITLTAPSAPQVLSATPDTGTTVLLVWGHSVNNGSTPIITYRVYRSTTSGAYGPFLAETPNATYRDASSFLLGTPYYYVVTAVNRIGESSWSNEATIIISEIVKQISGTNNIVEVSTGITVSVDVSSPVNITIEPLSIAPTASSDLEPLGIYFNITLTDSTALLGMWINVSFIALGEQDPSNVRIYYFNETTQDWETVERTGVDNENQVIWGWTDHVTIFGVLNNLVEEKGVQEDWLLPLLFVAVVVILVVTGIAVGLYLTIRRQRRMLRGRLIREE
ncbi:MAG: fibronectin type III domain-containing protein [Candidatus Heimdallarchaeota archaeon]